jgi:hypothetical protein
MFVKKQFSESNIIIVGLLVAIIITLIISVLEMERYRISGYSYVTSNSKDSKIHYPWCKWAKKIRSEKVCFTDINEAKNSGKEECKVCQPYTKSLQNSFTVYLLKFYAIRQTLTIAISLLVTIPITFSRRKKSKPVSEKVYRENEFWREFPNDLMNAKIEVIIVSPFISEKRINLLMRDFEKLINRGVVVRIIVRNEIRYQSNKKKIIDNMKSMGIMGFYRIRKFHYKGAIIDRKITWFGTMNILSHIDGKECMERIEDPIFVKQLLDKMDIK